jgi:prefoldin beta subunit
MAEDKKSDQQMFAQFQAYQQQLQSVLMQKENLRLQILEIGKALEELEASKSADAYKIVGPIMVKKTSDEIKTELKERKESFELRIKSLESTENKIMDKLKSMEEDLKKMLKK